MQIPSTWGYSALSLKTHREERVSSLFESPEMGVYRVGVCQYAENTMQNRALATLLLGKLFSQLVVSL